MKINKDDIPYMLAFIMLGISILILIYVCILGAVYRNVQRTCWENGWARSNVTTNLHGYCMRFENGTEIIVPVEDVFDGKEE